MTTKQYLMQMKQTTERLNTKMSKMGRMCRRAQLPAADDGEPQQRMSDLQADLCREIDALMRHQGELSALIARLDDPAHRSVLTLRYLCGLRWEQIARRMHYSSRHLHRIHKQALEELAEHRGENSWAS